MEDSKSYFRLGLFVVTAILIATAVLFILGGRSLFTPKFTFETYFNASVAGLDIGAPVRFRGVPMGEVAEITTSASQYEGSIPFEKRRNYIVVRARVSSSFLTIHQIEREFDDMVTHGMRVQTQLAGVTGQQYLALDILDPTANPPLPFDWKPNDRYVPSAPSLTAKIVANAQEFVASLNDAKIEQLSKDLDTLIVTLNDKIGAVPVADLSTEAVGVLKDARGIVARLDRYIADPALKRTLENVANASDRLRGITDSGDLERMVKRLDDLAQRVGGIAADNQYDVRVIVQDLSVTSDNMRALSEQLKAYPAGALVGGPPDPVQLPGKSR